MVSESDTAAQALNVPIGDRFVRFLESPTWDRLSPAARLFLTRRFGRRADRKESARRVGQVNAAGTPALFLVGTPTNVRVNDPAEDAASGVHTTQNRPSLTVNGPNVVVGFDDSSDPTSYAGLARSTDGGASFVDEGALAGSTLGDVTLADDGTGRLYYSTLVENMTGVGIGVARSTDGGTTFGEPVILFTTGRAETHLPYRPWLVADKASANLYVAWVDMIFVPVDGNPDLFWDTAQIQFARSVDAGVTWSPALALSPETPKSRTLGVTSAVAPDSTLCVIWTGPDAFQILVQRSDDAGLTFSDPGAGIGPVVSIAPRQVNGIPAIAVDGAGTVYIVYSATDPFDVVDVYLVRSTDRGRTWSAPLLVNDDGTATDQWAPSVAVAANGVVGVMFYDRRNDPANINTDVYLAQSSDGGMSFMPNLRITNVSSPPLADFETRLPWDEFGDYIQVVAQGNAFYMAWGDNRDVVVVRHDPDVFFARQDSCQLNRVAIEAIDEEVSTLENAIASGAFLVSQLPAIRRLIGRLLLLRRGQEDALELCLGLG
jgi:hypothetical protein